jgi:phenylpropionate dioxygenase-like ring-hydroxylating dioxygenase large terminal subunit
MKFLKNAWYVAGWASDIKAGALFHRRILGEDVLLYRTADGNPAAIADRCPHRFAPLHLGKLVDDVVQCPYHGLRFDRAGACVANPHGPVPKAARVKSYPVLERCSAVWIWTGEPSRADPNKLPPFDFLVPENWYVGTDSMLIDAPYDLEIDNILDLSHIEFLHPLFASDAVRAAKVQSSQEADTVWSRRYIARDTLPDFLMQAFHIPAGELADRWLDVRWNAPALMVLYSGAVVSGKPREHGMEVQQAHFFTPETAQTTHYFYSMSFPRALGPAGAQLAADTIKSLRGPFQNEDKPIVEAVARNMGGADFWDLKPVLLSIDGAAVKARRVLERLIQAEQVTPEA